MNDQSLNGNLHLPPERDVPDPDAMFASILAAGPEFGSSDPADDDTPAFGAIDELAARRRRRFVAPFAVAAGLGLLALGVGASQLLTSRPNSPAGTPTAPIGTAGGPSSGPSLPVTKVTVSSTTSAGQSSSAQSSSAQSSNPQSSSQSSSQSSEGANPISFELYGKATLKYVTIERLAPPTDFKTPAALDNTQAWYLRICVTSLPEQYQADGKLPIGAGAFRSELLPGKQNLNRVSAVDGYQPAYPESGSSLALGECATGFVTFSLSPYEGASQTNMLLTYQNSLGDPAVTWTLHP